MGETQAALHITAPLVAARIGGRREELADQVPVAAVHGHRVKARRLHPGGGPAKGGGCFQYGILWHVRQGGNLLLGRVGVAGAAGGLVMKLHRDARAVTELFHQGGQLGQPPVLAVFPGAHLVGPGPALGAYRSGAGDDQPHPALGQVIVQLEQLISNPAIEVGHALHGGRAQQAVFHLHAAHGQGLAQELHCSTFQ